MTPRRFRLATTLGIALGMALSASIAAQGHDDEHWAFTPPAAGDPPAVRDSSWSHNPIDAFVHDELARAGFAPSEEADRATLIRRVSLALTGLPPGPDEVAAFVADPGDDAFEQLVQRLLDSPHYGERMAKWWLDLARYADTDGYHIDGHRDMWKWREWVIRAFNDNQPFDQFTVEQLAGDLLPNRTTEQWLATGFNRNHMTNIEGGADPDEYAVRYVVDRANTTSTVWMGLTMKCAECHDHKYDPISQRDYYRFFALFNNVPERGLDGYFGNAAPIVPLPSDEQMKTLIGLTQEIKRKEQELVDMAPELARRQAEWEARLAADPLDPEVVDDLLVHYPLDGLHEGSVRDERGVAPGVVSGAGSAVWGDGVIDQALALDGIGTHIDCGRPIAIEKDTPFSVSAWINLANGGSIVSQYDDEAGQRGFDFAANGYRLWFFLSHDWQENAIQATTVRSMDPGTWYHVAATYDGSGSAEGVALYIDGERQDVTVEKDSLTRTVAVDQPLRIGRRSIEYGFQGAIDDVRVYRRPLGSPEILRLAMAPTLATLAVPRADRSPEQVASVATYYRDHVSPEAKAIREAIAPLVEQRKDLVNGVPTSMVMDELAEPRPTHILTRGDYRKKGDQVTAGVPEFLPQLGASGPANRLAFARWLTRPDHPLTARVTVNRLWEIMFGAGLVKTSDDFGLRGDDPSHPRLLDWLAREFVSSGWNVKHVMRLIATSRTFRQSGSLRPDLAAVDPDNRLLGRSPRPRLDAETIRDNALAIAGLLDLRIGGESVRPFQPPGLWEEIAFGGSFLSQTYEMSEGADLYRRGLYVYWKRSSPYASFRIFDAPTRELCTVNRSSTNTPLQALVLMDDPVYVEAARALASRILTEGGDERDRRLAYAIRLCVARAPRPDEVEVLGRLLELELARFRGDPEAAEAFLTAGEFAAPESIDRVELAAWTMVASTLLNTSEVITRP